MARDLTIAVVGASGALGKELLSVLDAAPWRPGTVLALARAATVTPFVDYGEDQIAVDALDNLDLGSIDGMLVATPMDVAGPLVTAATAAGVPVIDCSGSQLSELDVPMGAPWLDPALLTAPRSRDVVSLPSAPGLMLATVLAPLARHGMTAPVRATVMLPASGFGRAGVEELSQQVIALFNAGTPARKIFPQGLAFDLVPQVGESGATGWTAGELRVAAELARMTRMHVDPTIVAVPLFSGLSASIFLGSDADWPASRVQQVLADAGLEVMDAGPARRVPRPRRVEGEPGVHVARIRGSLHGDGVHVFATMDNLRVSAVAAVGLLAGLLDAGRGDA